MKRLAIGFASFAALWSLTATVLAATAEKPKPAAVKPAAKEAETPSKPAASACTLEMRIEGAITPGALDYLERGIHHAETRGCGAVLLNINTPGGALNTTRLIVERILASPVPILCLVSPSGGHAGSAGAIIMMACHVNGAEPATDIGAATPISGSGDLEKDVRKKAVEDTVSWVVGLARLRGRDLTFAEKIVSEAKALDAQAALEAKAIDTVVPDAARFLEFAHGRKVAMKGGVEATVAVGPRVPFDPDLRTRFLQLVTDPQIAYLIFMASLALLYFEFTHTGVVVPGVVGALGLLVSQIAFHFLEVRWSAAALIALGLAFLIAEAFVPSFGALGVGGIIALGAGSLLLYEPTPEGPVLPYSLIAGVTLVAGAFMMTLAVLAFRTRRKGPAKAETAVLGQIGEVLSVEAGSADQGMIVVLGEYWKFKAGAETRVGEKLRVIAQDGMTLKVEPLR